MKMVGIDVNTKVVTKNMWCHQCQYPPLAEEYRVDSKH